MNKLHPLTGEQAAGADPGAHAWVSASAGAGKTQLLAARVLRLLLAGAAPERLLALTFTKAAAAEMQNRVFERLARWAAAGDAALDADLVALGAAEGAAARGRARSLFARALDARGGLQVKTLHAFAGGLLGAFPVEAGVPADFTLIDDRAAGELRDAAVDALVRRDRRSEPGLFDDLAELAVRHGEGGLDRVFETLLRHGEAIAALGAPAGFEMRMRGLFGLPREGEAAALLADAMAAFDCGPLHAVAARLGKAEHVASIRDWLACDGHGRCASLAELIDVFDTTRGEPRQATRRAHPEAFDALREALAALVELRDGLEAARLAAAHLRVGAALVAEHARLKARGGALGFDDVIARAAALLGAPGASDWVRMKLDQRIDHILVDEAQDTNAGQWAIIRALAGEFFAGEGARDGGRTLFAVGDHKQSIFGFQGADPAVFARERRALAARGTQVRDVALTRNFRSAPAVLAVVDAVLAAAGPRALGLAHAVPAHVAERDVAGAVTLWPPVLDDRHEAEEAEAAGERGWVSSAERKMARRLAAEIRGWLDGPPMLRGRAARPEDILILVRKRREFIPVLVSALQDARVPVAGADRLRLTAALAVRDVMSLMRFAAQPDDDLSLAELLVSPLIGWSQDALLELAHGREGSLWRALREAEGGGARAAAAWLGEALARADYQTPHVWLEVMLSGPPGGRARLLARLGVEAIDPLDALVAAAIEYEVAHPPSLRGFLAWLEAGEAEAKRDPGAPAAEVRIMTVHGAKGLQAPIVVLADAATDARSERAAHVVIEVDGRPLPVFHGGAAGKLGAVGDACAALEVAAAEEEMRLLYVALTRAEDLLFVGGACGKVAKAAGAASWHARVGAALAGLGARGVEDARWRGTVVRHASGTMAGPVEAAAAGEAAVAVPAWARAAPPAEARPARPLTPSRIGGDAPSLPPMGVAAAAAARRGAALHALFERLPGVAADARRGAGERWLAAHAGEMAADAREAVLADALRVIEDARFARLFGPDALAEAPLAARVGEVVVAGKVDRLLVEADRVLVVDFKTGARVPAIVEAAPTQHLAQMAAYAAALGVIFPGRAIEAALLYTAGPVMLTIPPALLARHAP